VKGGFHWAVFENGLTIPIYFSTRGPLMILDVKIQEARHFKASQKEISTIPLREWMSPIRKSLAALQP